MNDKNGHYVDETSLASKYSRSAGVQVLQVSNFNYHTFDYSRRQ